MHWRCKHRVCIHLARFARSCARKPAGLERLTYDRAAKAVVAANPKTVLYDIARRAVYMPDGERLEAHSGLGQYLDDPQSIERKDVGVTPPNVYAVSFREKPFHGVRALRGAAIAGDLAE